MTTSRTLTKEDNVFATLFSQGKTIKSIVSRNFTKINDIINIMCNSCGDYRGLAHLNIRNQTQGWSMNMLLRINNCEKNLKEKEPARDGLQYCFSF